MTINVMFLAAEAEPFIKVGGLGDVAGALPPAIHLSSKKLPAESKVDIRMVLPYHFAIKQKGFKLKRLGEFSVENSDEPITCQVYRYDQGNIPVYFLDGDPIDEKSPVYSSDPILDGYKFVFFSVAALKLANFLNWHVDILQGNDWHTATAIYALRKLKPLSANLRNTKTIHTLHNLPYMGVGVQDALADYGLPASENPDLPSWARHTPLPLGLLYADRIIAVSPHYAEEILTHELGCGLDNFLRTRRSAISGILNGLDTDIWDPEKDPYIERNFSNSTLSPRKNNKTKLQKDFKLLQNENIPLLTLISRMDPQKGIDIALKGLKLLKDIPWQAIILGTGNPHIEKMAQDLETAFPNRVRSTIAFDNKLAHQLYAGADIFLMPSRYEPCGLSQMIAMRYGCVPIARATGGLVNTITHVSRRVNSGTGFLFSRPYPSIFARTLKRVLRFYQNQTLWKQIQHNGMTMDFSWEKSAQKYIAVYQNLIHEH